MTRRLPAPRTAIGRTFGVLLAAVVAIGVVSATSVAGAATEATLFGSAKPVTAAAPDARVIELGVVVVPKVNGTITGIRFYKSTTNTGTHTGSLWNSAGTRLAKATFSGETASGWQTVRFAKPIAVTKGAKYTASYYAPKGHYGVTRNAFATAVTKGDLTVPANGGVYVYGSSTYPKSTYQGSNYFVDVLFVPAAAPPAPSTPPATTTPAKFQPGNPSGTVAVPAGMGLEDTSHPDRVVGNGTAASCTSAAVVAAVAAGGVITFSCGSSPVTITLTQTLKVRNNVPKLVIDGGGLVTLSGGNAHRILYIDTCDTSLGSVSGNCLYSPQYPNVTVQNLTMTRGNATNETYVSPGDTGQGSNGGGAIFALGGRLKVVRSVFTQNVCAPTGPDLGGGAIRVLAQHSATPNDLDPSLAAKGQDPVAIVQSTFGGAAGAGNTCSNGAAISGLRTPITVVNSLITNNSAVGCCANPPHAGTVGGGSGGAIYTDGGTYDLRISGSSITSNTAKAGGSAIFYVSNSQTGQLFIDHSVISGNTYAPSGQSTPQSFQNYPGIFYLGKGAPVFTASTIQ
jgi:hypothetical protein